MHENQLPANRSPSREPNSQSLKLLPLDILRARFQLRSPLHTAQNARARLRRPQSSLVDRLRRRKDQRAQRGERSTGREELWRRDGRSEGSKTFDRGLIGCANGKRWWRGRGSRLDRGLTVLGRLIAVVEISFPPLPFSHATTALPRSLLPPLELFLEKVARLELRDGRARDLEKAGVGEGREKGDRGGGKECEKRMGTSAG